MDLDQIQEEPAPPVHERLYSLAQYLNKRKDEQRSKQTDLFYQTLQTQQFRCSPKSAEMTKHRQPNGENYGQFLYDEAQRLHEESKEKIEQHRKKKQDSEVEDCTFQPEISEYAKQLLREEMEPVYLRLDKLDKEHKARLDDMARHANEDSAADLTFQPKITNYPLSERRGDFYSHVKDKELRKQLRLVSLQQEVERQQGITHHPEISEYSKNLIREDGQTIFQRLHTEAAEKKKKLQQKQQEAAASFDAMKSNTSVNNSTNNASASPEKSNSGDEDVPGFLYQDAENRKIRRQLLIVQKELEEQAARNERKISNKSAKIARQRTEEEVRFLLTKFDTNNDGRLDPQEFKDALTRLVPFKSQEMGLTDLTDSEQELVINRVWRALDPDNVGYCELGQWFRFITGIAAGDPCGMGNQDDALEQIALAVAHEFVMGCLALKLHEPLPIRRSRSKEIKTREEIELSECTFRPSLNKNSTKIVQANLSVPVDVDRFELLHTQHKEKEEKKKEMLNKNIAKEMEECTFTPKINKKGGKDKLNATINSSGSVDRESFFEQLATPERSRRRPRSAETKTTLEKELEEHCSFAPTTTPKRPVSATSTPRGYKETIERMLDAKQEKEKRRAEAEARFKTDKYAKNRNAKPFNFMTEQRHKARQAPLLFVDVNLGGGRSGRIGIHSKDDDPAVLARNFATAYSLDDNLRMRLERLLLAHIQQLHAASSVASEDSPSVNATTPRVSAAMRSMRSPNRGRGYAGSGGSTDQSPNGRDDSYEYTEDDARANETGYHPAELSQFTAAQRAEAILQVYQR